MALEPKRNKLLNPAAVDRISKLPRKLLCRILAFLPTRCAVATSILSKKWKYVWTEIPVLDFTDLPSSMISTETVFNREQGLNFFSVCSSSVKTLSISAVDYKKKAITLKTPTLEVLHLSIDIMQSLVTDLSSLVEVRLNIWTSSVRWINFLQKFCYTQTLVLYQIILDGSIALYKIPIFENLTHLEVGFTAWSTVLQILRRAPNLASFTIYKLMFDWPDIKLEIKGLPLNKIEYHGFDVDEGFKVIKYFLGNSMLLKEL
ncbi:putative F-box/FBD/LRR-repeat protein At5g56810 [Chenopodium quinoa]|uniref:putative F-box/FBD/LRR-repeat protein At5g56810 n=1 Tax=Chenopodium quinoa TaxID=63459 RepID=UPI000B77716C|nr:putative F-box/FBD/LRR-repeat protein At5g56810 [Chenopodium quinoa]